MMKNICLFCLIIFFLSSCSPTLTPFISKSYAPLPPESSVKIYAQTDSIGSEFETLGVVKVNKLAYRTTKDSIVTVYKLKEVARGVGANAIKMAEPKRGLINASVIYMPELSQQETQSHAMSDSIAPKTNYPVAFEYGGNKRSLPSFILAGNIGFGSRTAKIADGLSGTNREILKDTRSGLAWDASAKYYFNDMFGIGGMFSLLNGSSDAVTPIKVTSSILFVGPAFLARFKLPKSDKWIFNCSLGIGYIGYDLSAKYLGEYEKITGESVGFLTDVGIEHRVHENFGIAFNITSVDGNLSELTRNVNGNKQTEKLGYKEYESLSNFRFSIGLRYYIK